LPTPGGPNNKMFVPLIEANCHFGQCSDAGFADRRDGGEVETVEGLAHGQSGFKQMPGGPSPRSFGHLVLPSVPRGSSRRASSHGRRLRSAPARAGRPFGRRSWVSSTAAGRCRWFGVGVSLMTPPRDGQRRCQRGRSIGPKLAKDGRITRTSGAAAATGVTDAASR